MNAVDGFDDIDTCSTSTFRPFPCALVIAHTGMDFQIYRPSCTNSCILYHGNPELGELRAWAIGYASGWCVADRGSKLRNCLTNSVFSRDQNLYIYISHPLPQTSHKANILTPSLHYHYLSISAFSGAIKNRCPVRPVDVLSLSFTSLDST
jgi:hypothetical protein